MSVLPVGFGSALGGFNVERSLRFNSADSAYIVRQNGGTAGNRKVWTLSFWMKPSVISTAATPGDGPHLFMVGNTNPNGGGGPSTYSRFLLTGSSNNLVWGSNGSSGEAFTSTNVFRDLSAWYHVVVSFDATNTIIRCYVNNQEITYASRTNPSNTDSAINAANYYNSFGIFHTGDVRGWSGYLTEFNFIDGQALTPSSFGETDTNTGIWKPKAYSSSYGTHGAYLKFADNSNTTAATLGKDSSGNGNNWTPNNFSVTAGAGNDSLVDTPTSYGTDTGVGGEVRGNYCTLNALWKNSAWSPTNGNLTANMGSGTNGYVALGSFAMPAGEGKWYFEIVFTSGSPSSANQQVGIVPISGSYAATQVANTDISNAYSTTNGYAYNAGGTKNSPAGRNATYTGAASWGVNDVVGVAFDAGAGTLTFYKNGVSQGQAFSGITTSEGFYPAIADYAGLTVNINCGQRPWYSTAPSGFKALCTQNLPTPTIGATSTTQANDYFDILLYNGNNSASTRSITGLEFQPDFIWIKNRNGANSHRLTDAVRGSGISLLSNSTSADVVSTTYAPSAFISGGFQTTTSDNSINGLTTDTYVAWNWKANGAGSSNTAGTITSTVSANTTSGFSIVTFNIPGSGTSDTVGHGLGVAPSMVILKPRTAGTSWGVYHSGLTSAAYYLTLQTTNGQTLSNNWWNSTAPTSSVFTIGATWYGTTNAVAYCFAPVAGYSAFGSYTGNGSADGPFVYTGFRPAFVMIKPSSAADNWQIEDSARNTFNVINTQLFPNLSNAEATSTTRLTDFLSNGFKIRGTNAGVNGNGTTFIYAAFAESPFKYALAR